MCSYLCSRWWQDKNLVVTSSNSVLLGLCLYQYFLFTICEIECERNMLPPRFPLGVCETDRLKMGLPSGLPLHRLECLWLCISITYTSYMYTICLFIVHQWMCIFGNIFTCVPVLKEFFRIMKRLQCWRCHSCLNTIPRRRLLNICSFVDS